MREREKQTEPAQVTQEDRNPQIEPKNTSKYQIEPETLTKITSDAATYPI